MELFCWAGGWGLPSVDPDCLAVLVSGGGAGVCPVCASRPGPPLPSRPLSSLADVRAVHGSAAEGAPGQQPLEEPLR